MTEAQSPMVEYFSESHNMQRRYNSVSRIIRNNAKKELKFAEEFDYRILNDSYETASIDIIDIVIDGKSSNNKDKINLKILRDMLS